MTNTTLEHSVKSSFTIKPEIYKKLKLTQNKSKLVNDALSLYFERNDYLKNAEEIYWNKKLEKWLNDIKIWNTTKINPNWEIITDDILNKTLWA